MSKNIANYVGFSSFLERANSNKGFWNLFDQIFFKRKDLWVSTSNEEEYVFFGGESGTIPIPSSINTIKIAGCGGGGNGTLAFSQGGGTWDGGDGGGGAASNIVGNSFPTAGIVAIDYSVGIANSDTYVKVSGFGGSDIIRFRGGTSAPGPSSPPTPGESITPGGGGPADGGGPNAVAGGAGGSRGLRSQSPASPYGQGGEPGESSPSPGGCGGGGGGGSIGDPGATTLGGIGGSFTANPNVIVSIIHPGVSDPEPWRAGPAPDSWSLGITPVSGTRGNNSTYAYAYGGTTFSPSGPVGGGGGGGAGVGIRYIDPSSPENGKYFGGGGGGDGAAYGGATPTINPRQGGKGLLIIQLRF